MTGRPTVSPARRLARVAYGTSIGLALGTVIGLAASWPLAPALGAAAGAVVAVVHGRLRERRA
jgi:hypothetical protein